jgi:hypothetical protein
MEREHMARERDKYDIKRYFSGEIPEDALPSLKIDGIRFLKPGSKFKVVRERGEYTFLYVRSEYITCFDPYGCFTTIHKSKVKRALNLPKRRKK